VSSGQCAVGRGQPPTRVRYGVPGWAVLLMFCPVIFMASCRTVPLLPPAEAGKIPAAFEAGLPDSFKAQQTLVFEFKPHWWWPTIRMTALGYATVNRKTGDYAVVCLSPLGVKLFDVACSNGVTTTRLMIPARGDQSAMGKAISDDISNLYFNLTPPPDADVKQRGERVIFRGTQGEYEFNGTSGELVRKVVWTPESRSTLTFGDYSRETGLTYPATMTLENNLRRYRLMIKTVKLRPLAAGLTTSGVYE
jgi:hypothetical protein